ncbi:hypothetical protein [Polaromonas sp.]|uniref:hypothetical protein n=1 Tax=Polaromonas sp. TaxID=1869339 RepID=UPI0027334EFE|nr:hypothetical protein [Polaromonas sp.]MDP3755991.1 hypothetical protein [Polaromonas sp.]
MKHQFDEVLQFESVAVFAARPNYVAQLQLGAGELDRIIGKYELPGDKALWAVCGLNHCNTQHRYGYVICAKDGQETNIGKDCGAREFDVEFEEVVARFQKAVDAHAKIRSIKSLLNERGEMLARLEKISPQAQIQSERMRQFCGAFQHQRSFWTQLHKCAKLGGVVRAAARQDKDWSTPGSGREQLVTVGRFAGSSVLLDDGTNLHQTLNKTVRPWLQALDETALVSADQADLDGVLREAGMMKRLIDKTEKFVTQASIFLTKENIAQLEPICTHLMRKYDAADARADLEKWVAGELSRPLGKVQGKKK